MTRRKLALFTLLFASGIACGYFLTDRSKTASAAGFALSVFLCMALFDAGSGRSALQKRSNGNSRMKLFMTTVFVLGILVFSLRYFSYEHAVSSYLEKGSIRGRVLSAAIKDDDLRMTVKSSEDAGVKISVTVRGYVQQTEYEDHEEGNEICRLIGSVIEADGNYSEILPTDDPGCFDHRLYMRSRGVCVSFNSYSFAVVDPGNSPLIRFRRYLYLSREAFIKNFDGETGTFIRGVIFGDKSGIDDETEREFDENSTGHLLAVSGLHVGFLYGLLRMLTGKRTDSRTIILITAIIIIYGEMTMWSSATVRATIVICASLLAMYLKRQTDLLTSLSIAALAVLISEPYQLFNAGFQMSFLAMCGIAFLTKPISSVMGEALGVMIAVQAGTIPLIAYYYNMFNPLAALINVPVILLASVLVPFSLMMLMTSMVFGIVPGAAVKLIELISYAVIKTNHILNFGGGYSFDVAGLKGAAVIAVYLAMFGASSEWVRVRLLRCEKKTVVRTAALILLPVMMLGSCLYDPYTDDEIVFVAVGQGDCVHVKAEGHNILIDGGGSETYDVGENVLKPYLLFEGAGNVDMALLTHLHTDHFKGICDLSEIYPVGAVGIPADYEGNDLRAAGLSLNSGEIIYVMPDTKIDITGDVYIEPIWPVDLPDEAIQIDDPNEHNTVYMIHYRGVKVMVTGDLLEEDEHQMVRHYQGTDTLRCDVLKVAHHGSRSSSCDEFLDAASPSLAVIQVGRNNLYGHPHKQTLEKLEERGIMVLRTDMNGAVGLDIRHGRIYIDLFHTQEHS